MGIFMRYTIDGLVFKDMIIAAALSIDAHKHIINELNVFPVPDGDTGTNMSLTMGAAMNELKKSEPAEISRAAEIAAKALLRGGRGNSGTILSQLFRGFSRALKDKAEASARDFAHAMNEGVTTAYNVVNKPSEGTILTVSRIAAAAACDYAETGNDIEQLLETAIEEGGKALADTINQNPVLKKAGVIDAGGKGYMIILEAMLAVLRGEMFVVPEPDVKTTAKEKADFSGFDTGDITFCYCTEFIISRENTKASQLLCYFLGTLGDSVVVIDDEEIIKVHVHTNRPGDVLTEALTYGSLLEVKVENMREQHTETIARELDRDHDRIAPPEKPIGVVAICAGSGIEAVFKDLGCDRLVSGGQTMNPSTDDILKAVNSTPSETVFILPNNSNILFAAEQCVDMSPKNVVVIPTCTIPQGISAMLALDPEGGVDENSANMNQAIKGVHTISVTHAVRDSFFDNMEIKQGDYLAMLENQLLAANPSFENIQKVIIDTIKGFSPEFITVFYGSDVDDDTAGVLSDEIAKALPDSEITTVNGGQPVYYYVISVE